jgi:hypothetical protein
VPVYVPLSVYLVFACAALRYYLHNHFNFTISLWRAHFRSIGGFCPVTSHLPFALGTPLADAFCPGDTHHTPRTPHTHTLPPTAQNFNFYTLLALFNFYPHFSAILPPLEYTFYPRSRFYTLFTPLGASLFTTPFFTLFTRGRDTFYTFLHLREAFNPIGRPLTP